MHAGSGGGSIVASRTTVTVMRASSERQNVNAGPGAGQHSNQDKRVQFKRKQR